MISLGAHGLVHVKRYLGRWFVFNEEIWQTADRIDSGTSYLRGHESLCLEKMSVEQAHVGPHSLQGVVPGTTSNPIHCCPCGALGDSGPWFWHTQTFSSKFPSAVGVDRHLEQSGSVTQGTTAGWPKRKWSCCNNSLQSAIHFLLEISKITGRTHPRETATGRKRSGNKNPSVI